MELFTIAIVAFIAFSGYCWVRVDSLLDRRADAGPRIRRSLSRQVGAMAGWYCLAAAAVLTVPGYTMAASPFAALGLLLVVAAIASRRRGDAPLFWRA